MNVGSLVYDLNLNVSASAGASRTYASALQLCFSFRFVPLLLRVTLTALLHHTLALLMHIAQLRVNNELLDWGPDIPTEGAYPIENFESDDFCAMRPNGMPSVWVQGMAQLTRIFISTRCASVEADFMGSYVRSRAILSSSLVRLKVLLCFHGIISDLQTLEK